MATGSADIFLPRKVSICFASSWASGPCPNTSTTAQAISRPICLTIIVSPLTSSPPQGRPQMPHSGVFSSGSSVSGGLYRSSAFDLGGVSTRVSFGFNLANMGPKIQYSDRLLLRASAQRQPSLSDVRCRGALQPRGGGLLVRLRFGGGLAALEHDALLVAAHPRPLRFGPPRDTPPKPTFLGAFQGFDTNG